MRNKTPVITHRAVCTAQPSIYGSLTSTKKKLLSVKYDMEISRWRATLHRSKTRTWQ
jgi:hypothetical protein